ncbi:MAG: ABC transporter substrate-binding protein [Deltaproteobacteria bacterium]|nr:ABC transporter substrate-binding protein [Deltaproteobacteria bacterium]
MKYTNRLCFWLIWLIMAFPAVSSPGEKLGVGILPVVDVLPLLVGREKGLFKKQGIDLELINFQSALERDAALQSGSLDGYFGDILNTILLVQSGEQLKIIATAFHTHPRCRMFGIAVAPGSGITDPAGIKGKEVAISSATVIEYLLDQLLIAGNMSPGDVTKQEIKKIPIRLQMLLSGQVTAALLPEPLLTLAEANGAGVVLDDRQLNTALTVLAVNLKNRPKIKALIPGFLKAYDEAVDMINENPALFKELLITKTQFPVAVKDRYPVPVFPARAIPAEADVAMVQDWLQKNGLIKTRIPYADMVFSGR